MNTRPKPILRCLIGTTRLSMLALLASFLFGQGTGGGRPQGLNGLPEDWTSRFVVFSNENSPPDFVLQDPRFWLQYFKRHPAGPKASRLGHPP